MTLYEIDQQLMGCLNEETGEFDDAKFSELMTAKEDKIEGVLLWIKQLKADSEMIGNEIKSLQERKKAAENKAERLKTFIKFFLNGEKFQTAKVAVSYRSTEAVELDVDEGAFIDWAKDNAPELLTYKEPELSKSAIKTAIQNGDRVIGAHIEKKQAIIIK